MGFFSGPWESEPELVSNMKLRGAWLRELFKKDMRDLSYSE